MKKLVICTLFVIAVTLSGCADKDATNKKSDTTSQNEKKESKKQKITLATCGVIDEYSDGILWMNTSTEEYGSMISMVNKKGEIVAMFPNDYQKELKKIKSFSQFEDGYANISYPNETHVIDKNGDIVSTKTIEEGYKVASIGAGYTVVEKHTAGFDNNTYDYYIYNQKGEELSKYEPNDGEEHEVKYMGNGVFAFKILTEEEGWTYDIYSCKSNKWVRQFIANDNTFINNDKIIIDAHIYDAGEDQRISEIVILDENATVKKVKLPFESINIFNVRDNSIISKNNCLLVDDNTISILNLDTMELKQLNETYFSRVTENNIHFDGDYISLPLEGDDSKSYVGLFDLNFNIIKEPIEQFGYTFSNGRLAVTHINENDQEETDVYSTDLRKVFTIDRKESMYHNGYIEQKYSDNVFVDGYNSSKNKMAVYDLEGNNLYTKLNTESTKIMLVDSTSNTK